MAHDILAVQVADDDLGEKRVSADLVDVVERAAEAVVVEPARLHAVAEEQLQIDMFEALVHPPQRDAAGEDVEHHDREALGVGGVGLWVLRQVLVEHGEDAELVEASADDGQVPDGEASDVEVVEGHGRRSHEGSGGARE